ESKRRTENYNRPNQPRQKDDWRKYTGAAYFPFSPSPENHPFHRGLPVLMEDENPARNKENVRAIVRTSFCSVLEYISVGAIQWPINDCLQNQIQSGKSYREESPDNHHKKRLFYPKAFATFRCLCE